MFWFAEALVIIFELNENMGVVTINHTPFHFQKGAPDLFQLDKGGQLPSVAQLPRKSAPECRLESRHYWYWRGNRQCCVYA